MSDDVTIRRVFGEEILTAIIPIQAYAFSSTPTSNETIEQHRRYLAYTETNTRLAAFSGDRAQAVVVGIPMRQNVRGANLAMLGVSGVASDPAARRKGYVRNLLTQLHGQFRDEGHAVSMLNPFRPSFYERFGYVGFPKERRIQLFPDGLDGVARAAVPGDVSLHHIGDVFDDVYAFFVRVLSDQHGFGLSIKEQLKQIADDNKHWAALARREDEVVGLILYEAGGLGNPLSARAFLHRDIGSRTLLLQWLARHADQFTSFQLTLPPAERPDLWYTGVRYHEETKVEAPGHNAPMGRILSVKGLSGMAVGPAQAVVEVVDDAFVGGVWTLDGTGGALEVKRGGTATATLTSHGLAGLVYGVLDPDEIPLRGYGALDSATAAALRALFPAAAPFLYSHF